MHSPTVIPGKSLTFFDSAAILTVRYHVMPTAMALLRKMLDWAIAETKVHPIRITILWLENR